ncbi:MAG TPA: discoidin domain-containing protein [Candidatus Binatia bacterium]
MSDEHPPLLDVTLPPDPARWGVVTSGLAELALASTSDSTTPALRLEYDFHEGGGFVVAVHRVAVELPEVWEMRLRVRGNAPANVLEIKVMDSSGESVWRWKQESFSPPTDWMRLRIPSYAFEFAWGPAGGGEPKAISRLEIAVVAPPGGRGVIDISSIRLVDRGIPHFAKIEASSTAPGTTPELAYDRHAGTSWLSASDAGPHWLQIDFDDTHDVGGLVILWTIGALPASFRVNTRDSDGQWSIAYEATHAGAAASFVPFVVARICAIRIEAVAEDAKSGVGVADIDVRSPSWSRTPSEFLTHVAQAVPRGTFPRYLLREQILWTPVATPTSGPVGLINEDGAVEIGEGGFTIEPSLLLTDGKNPEWITWADVERSMSLEGGGFPLPSVGWHRDGVELVVTPFAEVNGGDEHVVVRYRVRNLAAEPRSITLVVSVRPFQVTPPSQAFRNLGGPMQIETLAAEGNVVRIGRDAKITSDPAWSGFGATTIDEGGLTPFLVRGVLPTRTSVADRHGYSGAALRFDLVVDASGHSDVFVACLPDTTTDRVDLVGRGSTPPVAYQKEVQATLYDDGGGEPVHRDPVPAGDGARRLERAIAQWHEALPVGLLKFPEVARDALETYLKSIGDILSCRDGVALQPGPRRYTRSWIRDGTIMAAALLRARRADAARAYIQWYGRFQREDGYVPCCVDRNGVDSLVEHDSHGQLIHAVSEACRFMHDEEFAQAMWPRCIRAAVYLESQRALRKTDEFRSGPRRSCFGLLPESVSHEGYLAHPVHSYWDDFWALRGYRDAAYLAQSLGARAAAAGRGTDAEAFARERVRWIAAADDLAAAIGFSVRIVMEERGLDTIPASVEWADFDPTAIAGAISLAGAVDVLPPGAVARTFDQYMVGVRARRDGSSQWTNYSPYEVRIVGALVRLGRRDDANELLDALLGDRYPPQWKQWSEIVWHNRTAPAHLGDLPHCWIGAEYSIALRSMLVYEHEGDSALVIGAGLRSEWLTGDGIEVCALPTWFGDLDLSIRRGPGGRYRVRAGGAASPPGGFVLQLPGAATLETA